MASEKKLPSPPPPPLVSCFTCFQADGELTVTFCAGGGGGGVRVYSFVKSGPPSPFIQSFVFLLLRVRLLVKQTATRAYATSAGSAWGKWAPSTLRASDSGFLAGEGEPRGRAGGLALALAAR